jgi:hypothetical protein
MKTGEKRPPREILTEIILDSVAKWTDEDVACFVAELNKGRELVLKFRYKSNA